MEVARKLDFAKPNNNKVDTISTIADVRIGVIAYEGKQPYKQDSIFWGPWMNTDIQQTAKILDMGANVDGIVGYDSDYTMELDFRNNTLKVWDLLPPNDLTGSKVIKLRLYDSDYGGTYLYRRDIYPHCIKSELTVLDTLKLHTNLLIDTGNPLYLAMLVFDSTLLEKLVEFKKEKGNSYPSTRLRIAELRIDTSFCHLRAFDKSQDRDNSFRGPIGGLAGMAFLRQFERVVFNKKKQEAWFEVY